MSLWGSEGGETHLTQFSSQRDTVLTWNSEQISNQNINWIAKTQKVDLIQKKDPKTLCGANTLPAFLVSGALKIHLREN